MLFGCDNFGSLLGCLKYKVSCVEADYSCSRTGLSRVCFKACEKKCCLVATNKQTGVGSPGISRGPLCFVPCNFTKWFSTRAKELFDVSVLHRVVVRINGVNTDKPVEECLVHGKSSINVNDHH
jgi:hypothetical protein